MYNSHNVEYQRYISLAKTNLLRYLFVPYVYIVERLACKHAALTVAISSPDADTLSRWGAADKIAVLPCAFDEAQINPFGDSKSVDPPVVLMVGNFGYGANRESVRTTVKEMVPPVVSAYADVIFRFVGREFPEDVRRDNVEAAGFVDDLNAEYSRASVIIAPIAIGGGVKIKVIEALASGKHLITTKKGMEGIEYEGLSNVIVAPKS